MEVIIVETPKTIAASTRECYITPRSTPIDSFFGTVSATDVRAELGARQDVECGTSAITAQPVGGAALIQPQTVTQKPQLMKARLLSLGREIIELQKFCTSQRNMHKDVIRRCSIIKRLHTEVMLEMDKEERRKELDEKNTPTQEMKARLAEGLVEITQSAKRVRTKSSPKETGKTKSPVAKKQKSLGAESEITPMIRDKKEEWIKVQKRPKQKPSKNITRTKTDAILIATKSEKMSYADILRAVKANDATKSLIEEVHTLRRTQKGELLLELSRTKSTSTRILQAAIQGVLKEDASVQVKTHMRTIRCKGLITDISNKEELLDALETQAKVRRPEDSAVRLAKMEYGGTQTAYISLPAEDAKMVLDLKHLRV